MINTQTRYANIPGIFLLLLTACATTESNYPNDLADQVRESLSATALGPGDAFEIRVYREKDLSGTFQVSPSGTIDYPFLGRIEVNGLTSSDLARKLCEGLGTGFLKDPYVTVQVTDFQSKRIYVLGQVTKPGTFRYEDGMSIIQAITLAGGLTQGSRPNATVVTRVLNGKEDRFVVPVTDISLGKARNLFLHPGDIVFVPESIL